MVSDKETKHYVYILRCADNTLYTGYTTDLEKRLQEHNGEGKTVSARSAGARYTSGRRPVELVYSESYNSRSEATSREFAIKKLSKPEKLLLINT